MAYQYFPIRTNDNQINICDALKSVKHVKNSKCFELVDFRIEHNNVNYTGLISVRIQFTDPNMVYYAKPNIETIFGVKYFVIKPFNYYTEKYNYENFIREIKLIYIDGSNDDLLIDNNTKGCIVWKSCDEPL